MIDSLRLRRGWLVLAVCLMGLLALPVAAAERDWEDVPLDELRAMPGIDVVEVEFEGKRVNSEGLAPFGKLPRPETVKFEKGKPEGAYGSRKSADDRQWMRHFPLEVTDAAFRSADHAAVDIYVTYHLPAWAGVQVEVNGDEGLYRALSGWGATKKWRTAFAAADDVDFAADGPHVRIVGANDTLYIKRVRIIGYRGEGEGVRWDRLVRPRKLETDTPDGIFAFPRGDGSAKLTLENLADADRPIDWRLRIETLDGEQQVHQSAGKATVAGGGTDSFAVDFDTSTWKLGPYVGRLDVGIGEDTLFTLPIKLGIIDDDPRTLPRARSNDPYWFGLDTANGNIFKTNTDLAFSYFDLMGVDITRNVPGSTAKIIGVDEAAESLSRMAQHGMRAGLIEFPDNWRLNGKEFEKNRDQRIARFAALAERFAGREPGQIAFIELGNEPDLTFFYGDSVDQYVQSYHMAYDAIRAVDPERGALVMNGGLCFHTDIGDKRARKIISLIDPDKI
ncbi:MAG: hypothetical protein AAF743_05660, partial [Planctomycetota bacterium]